MVEKLGLETENQKIKHALSQMTNLGALSPLKVTNDLNIK